MDFEEFVNDGYEPVLEIDKDDDISDFEKPGNYPSLDELGKDEEDKPDTPDATKEDEVKQDDELPDLKDEDEGKDWSKVASQEFERQMKSLGINESDIKTQNDYISVASKIGFLEEAITTDDEIVNARQFLSQSDKDILVNVIKNGNPLDSDDEIEEKLLKYYNADGTLRDRAKNYIDSTRNQVSGKINARFEDLSKQAEFYAKAQIEYRDNIYNHVRSLPMPEIEIDIDGKKVVIPKSSLSVDTRQELLKFSRDKYEESLVGKDIYEGEGYKKRVENSLWVNPKVRQSYLESIAKAAYEKGKSDTIKESIN